MHRIFDTGYMASAVMAAMMPGPNTTDFMSYHSGGAVYIKRRRFRHGRFKR